MDFDVRQRYINPNNEASSTISFAFSIFYIREADFYFYVFIAFLLLFFDNQLNNLQKDLHIFSF